MTQAEPFSWSSTEETCVGAILSAIFLDIRKGDDNDGEGRLANRLKKKPDSPARASVGNDFDDEEKTLRDAIRDKPYVRVGPRMLGDLFKKPAGKDADGEATYREPVRVRVKVRVRPPQTRQIDGAARERHQTPRRASARRPTDPKVRSTPHWRLGSPRGRGIWTARSRVARVRSQGRPRPGLVSLVPHTLLQEEARRG